MPARRRFEGRYGGSSRGVCRHIVLLFLPLSRRRFEGRYIGPSRGVCRHIVPSFLPLCRGSFAKPRRPYTGWITLCGAKSLSCHIRIFKGYVKHVVRCNVAAAALRACKACVLHRRAVIPAIQIQDHVSGLYTGPVPTPPDKAAADAESGEGKEKMSLAVGGKPGKQFIRRDCQLKEGKIRQQCDRTSSACWRKDTALATSMGPGQRDSVTFQAKITTLDSGEFEIWRPSDELLTLPGALQVAGGGTRRLNPSNPPVLTVADFATDFLPTEAYNVSLGNVTSAGQVDGGSLWTDVALGIVLGSLCLLTSVGNAMVLHAVRTNRDLQTVSNFFIVSLAVSDLAVGTVVMPLSTVNIVAHQWVLGLPVCQQPFDTVCLPFTCPDASGLTA
ncbi:Histamine H1 receptor [Branchiostoma belcheri]|nr:Histamine H1 receptor [Branchiostoma belcheri]